MKVGPAVKRKKGREKHKKTKKNGTVVAVHAFAAAGPRRNSIVYRGVHK